MKKKKDRDRHRGLCILILIILLGWVMHNLCTAQKIVGPIEREISIFILVTGIVTDPGVYAFERNPSLKEVMTKAGYSSHAELRKAISRNTHPSFTHGTRVNISSEHGCIYLSTGTMPAAYKITLHIPISLNTASLEDLDTIPGIGPAIGKNIIHYRYLHGPFKTVEEIQHVSGIGKIRYLQIKPYIGI